MSLTSPADIAHLPAKRLVGVAALIVCAALLAIARPAGAVTIGSDLSANASIGGPAGCPCTLVPTESHAVVVPEAGVLTTWRFKSLSGFDLVGEVFRLVVLKGNTVVAMDSRVLPSRPEFQQNLYEFKTSIPVETGERLGLEGRGDVFSAVSDPSVYMDQWEPPLGLNETQPPTLSGNFPYELLLNADIGAPSPPSGGGGSGGGTPAGKVKLLNGGPSPTILTDVANRFIMPAKCELPPGSPYSCSGAVVLRSISAPTNAEPGQHARAAAKPKSVVLGRGTFTIAPGQTKKIAVKLKPKAKQALKQAGKLKGKLTTTSNLTDGTTASVRQNLTLKLKPPSPNTGRAGLQQAPRWRSLAR